MGQEATEWELKILDVALNDPPITYTVKFFGCINSHMIHLTFELPTTVVRTVADWAPTERGPCSILGVSSHSSNREVCCSKYERRGS